MLSIMSFYSKEVSNLTATNTIMEVNVGEKKSVRRKDKVRPFLF